MFRVLPFLFYISAPYIIPCAVVQTYAPTFWTLPLPRIHWLELLQNTVRPHLNCWHFQNTVMMIYLRSPHHNHYLCQGGNVFIRGVRLFIDPLAGLCEKFSSYFY